MRAMRVLRLPLLCMLLAVSALPAVADGPYCRGAEDSPLSLLLEQRTRIDDELRRRGVMRTGNQLAGELAESLFARTFGWQLAPNSQRGHDAVHRGVRYQIKARRDSGQGGARQLSAIRNPEGFDFLAVIVFDRYFDIVTAAIIPARLVAQAARFDEYTNSYRFHFGDNVLALPGVIDVTDQLGGALAEPPRLH